MANNDVALMAHLMRRAGFGAQYHELEARASKGYEAMVEELLNPTEESHGMDLDLGERYFIEWNHFVRCVPEYIAFRMINSKSQLEEKMILFWHGILCHTDSKNQSQIASHAEWEMLRRCGMGNFKDLLLEISRDPAMVYFLDNCLSHKDSINENYGRELLELFSLGVGMDGKFNYTEDDVKECARAFTGWTIANAIPGQPYGRYSSQFVYNPDDHDDGEKTFLGHTGNLDGNDIIDIVCSQPATANFVARHLYNFFVAHEPQVPSWQDTPPNDPEAVDMLAKAFVDSNYDMRSVLRVLFNSDFFKDESVWYARVKSPVEVVVGTMRLVGDHLTPAPGIESLVGAAGGMGQILLNPPSVEGWHGGKEWINSGALVNRVNFVANRVGDLSLPGVQRIVERLGDITESISPSDFVDGCLELMGSIRVEEDTRLALIAHVERGGLLGRDTEEERASFARKVGELLQLIASSREYQFA